MTIGPPEPCRGIFIDELPIATALSGQLSGRTGRPEAKTLVTLVKSTIIPEHPSGPGARVKLLAVAVSRLASLGGLLKPAAE